MDIGAGWYQFPGDNKSKGYTKNAYIAVAASVHRIGKDSLSLLQKLNHLSEI